MSADRVLEQLPQTFAPINDEDSRKIDGGGAGLVILGGILIVGGTLAANEYVERKTGKDIAGHVGDAIKSLGNTLQEWGKKLVY